MGLAAHQVDEKPVLLFPHELVISTEAKRSGEICGSFPPDTRAKLNTR
jgi:hypothetical protein